MVRITRVHTGGGDGGETSLLTGERISKANPRIIAVGSVDELNALIGMVRMELGRIPSLHKDGGERATVKDAKRIATRPLARIQQELFDLGAELAGLPEGLPKQMVLLDENHADLLVEDMDSWNESLEPLSSFILPTGSAIIATLHLARTVARRTERCVCTLREKEGMESVRNVVISYLNRLSDWLFVLSRLMTVTLGEDEVLWTRLSDRK
jgi:cob(I)alamin adenosyltransferase